MSEPWETRAACNGDDPEKWFPNHTYLTQQTWDALEICDWCPVRIECLKTALSHKLEHGIWGGLLPGQRQRLAKRLSRKRTPLDEVDLGPHVQAVT
jgi:WhiB family transcriptional regulator, redox-sensing transcriptional regulator